MVESKTSIDPVRIRRITSAEDFDRLLEIQIDSIRRLTDTYTTEKLDAWANYIKHETSSRYAAFENLGYSDENNDLIAFVSWTTQGNSANIECLYTLPLYRGQKIGKFLLQEAETNLKDKTIHIRSTLNAQPFYEKNGYTFTAYNVSRAGFRIALLEKGL